MRYLKFICVVVALPQLAAAQPFNITNDTYVDSFHYETIVDGDPIVIDTSLTNYGHSGAIKAVSNNGSGSQYPLATSLVRGLFTLPDDFWASLGNNDVATATVTYRVRNNSLAGRDVELHPLTRTFVAGSGGVATNTQGGTPNTPTPLGADWFTYDGVNAWTTPGGDFDLANFALQTSRTVGSNAYFDWDIAPFLNDPTLRSLVQSNGLLLRVTNETTFTGNEFISLWSADGAAATGGAASIPTVTYTLVPEPSSTIIGLSTGLLVLVTRRRRTV